ncbi:hypothetical protein ACTA71_003139 [Dictyostelium dimigraforme]
MVAISLLPMVLAQLKFDSRVIEFNGDLIRDELMKDMFYNSVYKYLENNILPQDKELARKVLLESEFFVVIDSILYRGVKSNPSTTASKFLFLKIVIPPSLVCKILEIFHDSPFAGGHFGVARSYQKINERFYWKGMIKDVENHVGNCIDCNKSKQRYDPHTGFLIPMQIIAEPFHTIGIDFIGPFDINNERRGLLAIIDYFTKWPEAFFTSNQEAETVAKILVEQIFFKYGIPKRIVSDRGTNFLSNIFQKVNNFFGIKKLSTTAYHHQTNGLTENFNKTLIQMLKSFVNSENYGDWATTLRALLFAYRTTTYSSTGFSPFYLLFNRQPNLLFDTLLGVNYNNELILSHYGSYADTVKNGIKRELFFQKNNSQAVREKQSKYYNIGRKEGDIKVGDMVFIHFLFVPEKSGIAEKFYRPWKSPFKILQKLSDVTFRVNFPNNMKCHNVININRMKKF